MLKTTDRRTQTQSQTDCIPVSGNLAWASLSSQVPKTPIALFIAFFLFYTIVNAPPRWGANSGLAALIDKHERLEHLHQPKMILVGGSNVSTGLDSETIQKSLNYPVVNMGLGASLGLSYMAAEVKQSIKQGDIVVVSPEYDFFLKTTKVECNAQVNGSTDLINLVQVYPEAIKWVGPVYLNSPTHLFGGLEDLVRFVNLKIAFYKKIVAEPASFKQQKTLSAMLEPQNTIFTQRKNYNLYGDFVGHLTLPPPGIPDTGILNYQRLQFNNEAIDVLNSLNSACLKQQAQMLLVPPPIPRKFYDRKKEAVNQIFRRWNSVKNVDKLGTPERYTFEMTDMFDTPYHLNAVGRRRRTVLLIEDLEAWRKSHERLRSK